MSKKLYMSLIFSNLVVIKTLKYQNVEILKL